MNIMINENSKISVIIPSFDGCRNGNVDKLKSCLNAQTIKPYEIVVVIGVSPNGKARNVGVERAKADTDFFVFIDDDVALGHERILENLIAPFSIEVKTSEKPVGMTGPSQLIPDDSNWLQRTAAKQIPRSTFPIQTEMVDSDMVTHMCLCMPAKLFKDLGMENPDIISGTDPDLRYRVRQAGYRVCVVPDSWAYHPMPETFCKLMRLSFLKGWNSAIVRKQNPELVLELDEGFKKDFKPQRGLVFRCLRILGILILSVLELKFFKFANIAVYSWGNLWATITIKSKR